MIWNKHSLPAGSHALLSPSKIYWVNYDEERMFEYYSNHQKAVLGTRIHALAEECIRLSVRLPNVPATLNMFVNDAIGYKMEPEMMLYYSDNVFGTADAISFYNNTLRIHDLKTGTHPGSMQQLEIYAAIFCLEYNHKPEKIEIELRIYQDDSVIESYPEGTYIRSLMDKIKHLDSYVNTLKRSGNER